MKINSSYLDKNRFERDFTSLYRETDESRSLLDSILERISACNLSAASFLRDIDSIEDEDVQECCRMAAIAQMFNAKLDYRSGYPYVATSANSKYVLMLCFENSTAIISKYGEVVFDEGIIWANPRANFCGMGWGVRKVIDGKVSNKYGFITSSGERVLPCVFNELDLHIGECNAIYNHVPFSLRIYGPVDSVKMEYLESLIEWYDEEGIWCISEDSILFTLTPQRNSKVVVDDVKSLMSSLCTSREQLQKILKSKYSD